jgi:hypothetical protein
MKVQFIDLNGYKDCIEILNQDSRLVLEPNCGGRILCYEFKGINALYIDPREDGYLLESGEDPPGPFVPSAGRCDIGPETSTPPHPDLWLGKWSSRVLGERTAELTSLHDYETGVQLTRIFTLEEHFAKLKFTQRILNISESRKKYSHWSRTLCTGGGIAIAPLNEQSRYPEGYLTFGPGEILNYRAEPEPNVTIRDGILQVIGPAPGKKFAMDLAEGWFAYLTRDSRLFIRKFPVYPDRIYGEIASNNLAFRYAGEDMCEIEIMGPLETIDPSFDTSFTETWYLMEFEYPGRKPIKTSDIRRIIDILVM